MYPQITYGYVAGWLIAIACFATAFYSGTVYQQSVTPTPCIYNFADNWFSYMEQTELRDIDDTEVEKQFHDMIVKVVTEQKSVYTSNTGHQYIVPSYCYVEDTGFFVKLWRKEE